MTEQTQERRRPNRGPLPGLVLFVVIAGSLVLIGAGLFSGQLSRGGLLPWNGDCTVSTADGEVGLDREEAKLATTAVALSARGMAAPDTSDLDPSVVRRLAEGPPEDAGASLSCRGSVREDVPEQQPTATGLTPRAELVRESMTDVFGEQSLGGFAPGGVDQGHQEGSTHYEGRAIDIFFRPVSEENRRDGWMLAHWLVAHAEDLDIQYVIFDDQVWSARSSRGQWQDYRASDPGNEILRHLDHVHVDVVRGGTD